MMSLTPKVSVIIPTFNRAKYVPKAIDSVLAQTFQDFEILVVDDGSSDQTREVVSHYKDRVRYLHQKNAGVSTARNHGLRHSKGKYIAFLDDDDLWLPQKLESQVQIMEENPNLGFVCSESYVINNEGRIIDHWRKGKNNLESFESLRNENFILILTVLIRRKCFETVGGFDPQLKISQDYDLWLRLSKRYPFQYLEQPLTQYRDHPQGISKNISARLLDHLTIFSKTEINGDWNFWERHLRIARKFYQFAQLQYAAHSYSQAGVNYAKALLHCPFIGRYYWPQESERIKFSMPYRILKVYLLVLECFLHQLLMRKDPNSADLSYRSNV